MTEIKNETGTKKKLLIPVVVLMLLAVGLTGAAYAYSSTVTNSGNDFDANYLSIDLATGTPADDVVPVNDSGALVFTDNYTYNGAVHQDQVNLDVTTKKILTYNLKVSSDTDWNVIKITSSDIATLLAKTVDTGAALSTFFKISVNVNTDDAATAKEVKATATTETGAYFSVEKTATAQPVTAYIYIVEVSDGSVRNASNVAAENDHNAKYFSDLFDGAEYKFTLTFDASYVA